MSESNGKWQLAFWIITIICGTWLLSLTQGVVANDRIRVVEDQEIRQEIVSLMKDNSSAHMAIREDLVAIKSSLGIKR